MSISGLGIVVEAAETKIGYHISMYEGVREGSVMTTLAITKPDLPHGPLKTWSLRPHNVAENPCYRFIQEGHRENINILARSLGITPIDHQGQIWVDRVDMEIEGKTIQQVLERFREAGLLINRRVGHNQSLPKTELVLKASTRASWSLSSLLQQVLG